MATYTSKYNLKKPAPSDFADVADLNNNMDIIDEALDDKANLAYYTCGTSASTSAKVATVTAGAFELRTGASVDVKFTYANTASAPTLNVGGTGAKAIKMYGTTAPNANMWQAGAIVQFVYDGTYWVMQNGTTATTTYYGVTKLNSSVSSTSTTEAATPSAVKQAYDKANTAIPSTQKAAANGVASLDADGKVPLAQIPEGVGVLPRLVITAASGTTVTVKNGSTTLSKASTGTASFDLPRLGDWTITAGNYKKTLTVDIAKIYTIQALPLSEATWAQISEMSELGKAQEMWSIGDKKDIVVGDETLTLVIVDFNHDDLTDGSGKAGITFGLKNLMATTRRMEATNTNANGFTGSEMYTWLQGDLLSSLPADLQGVLKFVDKKTSAGNQSIEINTNSMKIFLFSEVEVFGTVNYSVEGEGAQYPYFATASNRAKYLSNGAGDASMWWERSPSANYSTGFCFVSGGGNGNSSYSSYAGGVCFGFCV